MAFRSGSVTGRGIVYSRRRGRGATSNGSFRNKASIIYEETEEESDDRRTTPTAPFVYEKPDLRDTSGSDASFNVLLIE